MPSEKKPNWDRIKADYLKGGTSYRELADKYGVVLKTLERRAKSEGWVEECRQVEREVSVKIHEQAVASRVMSAQEVLEELSLIARGGMKKIGTWGAGGLTLAESDTLDEETLSLVSEISETRTDTGGSLKVKLYDKLSALDKLAKHHGLYGAKDDAAEKEANAGVTIVPADSSDWRKECENGRA